MAPTSKKNIDLICFSHLRWNFVYQRPQHLMSRFAKHSRVFLIEEPVFNDDDNYLHFDRKGNVTVVVPFIKHSSEEEAINQQVILLKELFEEENITTYAFW